MLAFVLPILVTALQMQPPFTEAELEQALAAGVRAQLADGWTLVDVDGDYEELTLTLTKNGKVEQHVAHVDHDTGHAYRVDTNVPMPSHVRPPSGFKVLALAGGGGLEIGGDCGRIEARFYFLDASAKGAAAARLVARTLKAAEDIEGAYVDNGRAVITMDLANRQRAQLHVTLDDAHAVVAAELRRYEYGADMSTYTRLSKLKRSIGAAVTAIEDDSAGLVLVGKQRFALAMSHIEPHNPADEGCGC